MSHLPFDLLEDVFSRLPVKSVSAFRSVCKNWNTFCKALCLTKKSLAQGKAAEEEESEFMAVMVISGQVHLRSTNLHGIHRNHGKIDPERFYISKVYHCDGLLLCTSKGSKRFVVWNPSRCQTLWFRCDLKSGFCTHAIGYDNSKSCRSYKILRFHCSSVMKSVWYKVFYINSTNFAIPITIYANWKILSDDRNVSLKGNTYWIAEPAGTRDRPHCFLICFDFTREIFGPRLRLPFQISYIDDIVILSSVRDEQLAVLFRHKYTLDMEIWITTKIDPNFVSWRKLFTAVVRQPLRVIGSFFVDEEKEVAVVFDSDLKNGRVGSYIIGENGYFKKVDFEEPLNHLSYPSMCSYVPRLG